MKKCLFLVIVSLLLTGCGVKDPSFYDLKSPCVAIGVDESDPCLRTSPQLNGVYESISL